MIGVVINLGDFDLERPEVRFFSSWMNDMMEKYGYQYLSLEDVYSYRRLEFDNYDEESLDRFPFEEIFWVNRCVGCGFALDITVNEDSYYVYYPNEESDEVEITNLSNNSSEVRVFSDNSEYLESYQESYRDWYDMGDFSWE